MPSRWCAGGQPAAAGEAFASDFDPVEDEAEPPPDEPDEEVAERREWFNSHGW